MSTDAKTVHAEVLINSATVPVSQVVLRHRINELPQVTFNLQIDNRDSDTTAIDLPMFVRFLSNQQNYLVNRFRNTTADTIEKALQADLAVRVVDGDGKVLNFSGFLTQPSFSVMQGDLNLAFNGVHSMAAMQNLNLQLYTLIQLYALRNLTLPTGANESFNSICTHVDAILNNIFTQFETALDVSNRNLTELQGTHLINRAVYNKFVKNFLAVSKSRTIIPLVGNLIPERLRGSVQARVDGEIERLLLGGMSFLDAVMQGLIPSFKFQLNSNWNGQSWLEVIRTHEDVGQRVIVAPLENIKFDVAAAVEAPIQRVYVRCGRLDLYGLLDLLSNGNALRQMGAYPPITEAELNGQVPDLAPGVAYVVDAPEWMQDNVTTADNLSPLDSSDHSLSTTLAKFRGQEASFKATQAQRENLLQWLAEFTYKDHLLRYTSAFVSTPLMVDVEVGKTYLVKSPDGVELFSGYLCEATHSITLGQRDGTARTSLMFTHVKVKGTPINDLFLQRFASQAPQLAAVETFTPDPAAKILPDTEQV